MKKYLLIIPMILNGCSNNIDSNLSDNIPSFINDSFEQVCSETSVQPIKIHGEFIAWGFEPLLSDSDRKCEKVNLNNYSHLSCKFEKDLIGNQGIHLYKNSEGWYKFIYKNKNMCQDSLKIYEANSEE